MLCVGSVIIVGLEGKMKFTLTEIIRLRPVSQPCQLKRKVAHAVTQIDKAEAAVVGRLLADGLQTESGFVKAEAAVKVEDIEVKVIEGKHRHSFAILFF